MATLKEKLSDLIKTSMKSGDKDTLMFGRSLHSAIRKREIDDKIDADDALIQKIISTSLKQRQDSIAQFKEGGREDLVAKEELEVKFLMQFMPAQMSEAEVRTIVEASIAEAGATSAKDMGKVMKVLMPKVQGKADGALVQKIVKEKLV